MEEKTIYQKNMLSSESTDVLTGEEMAGVLAIRRHMKENYARVVIPELLNTDFNLLRWWTGNEGKLNKIGKKLSKYLLDRVILGFSGEDFVESYFASETLKRCKPFLAYSRLDDNYNYEQNCFIIYEAGLSNPYDHMRVMQTSDYLWVITGYCEYILRRVLHLESTTGRRATAVCVFDLQNVPILTWSNPFATHTKQTNYPDMVTRILVVNAVPAARAAMGVAKYFMDDRARKGLTLTGEREELVEILGKHTVPQHYGGDMTDESGNADRTTCLTIKSEYNNLKENHLKPGDVFARRKIDIPENHSKPVKHSIPANGTISIPIQIPAQSSQLCYQYRVTGVIDFGVRKLANQRAATENGKLAKVEEDEGDIQIVANWPIVADEVAEEAVLDCGSGSFVLDVHNRSRMFAINVHMILFHA